MFCLIFSLFSFNKYKNTGNVQTFTAPSATTYKLEVWGAQGANNGGKGGYSCGSKSLNSSINLYIVVGGKGRVNDGSNSYNEKSAGYNGGGAGQEGGGGASHIAIKNNRGVLKNYINNKSEVLIVAGGGGGACQNYDMINSNVKSGGDGGGLNGSKGIGQRDNSSYNVNGGSQNSGYTFGVGQNANTKTAHNSCGAEGNGGGGGGWYGGYSCQADTQNSNFGGGGGSGYIGGVTNGTTTAGVQSGNGKALITWMPLL